MAWRFKHHFMMVSLILYGLFSHRRWLFTPSDDRVGVARIPATAQRYTCFPGGLVLNGYGFNLDQLDWKNFEPKSIQITFVHFVKICKNAWYLRLPGINVNIEMCVRSFAHKTNVCEIYNIRILRTHPENLLTKHSADFCCNLHFVLCCGHFGCRLRLFPNTPPVGQFFTAPCWTPMKKICFYSYNHIATVLSSASVAILKPNYLSMNQTA